MKANEVKVVVPLDADTAAALRMCAEDSGRCMGREAANVIRRALARKVALMREGVRETERDNGDGTITRYRTNGGAR